MNIKTDFCIFMQRLFLIDRTKLQWKWKFEFGEENMR